MYKVIIYRFILTEYLHEICPDKNISVTGCAHQVAKQGRNQNVMFHRVTLTAYANTDSVSKTTTPLVILNAWPKQEHIQKIHPSACMGYPHCIPKQENSIQEAIYTARFLQFYFFSPCHPLLIKIDLECRRWVLPRASLIS